jgi:predicted SprT family Zn-dependent metalloprotease
MKVSVINVLKLLKQEVSEMTVMCNHSWEEQYADLKETKYQCTICGATQTVPRVLEKHSHEPMDNPDT